MKKSFFNFLFFLLITSNLAYSLIIPHPHFPLTVTNPHLKRNTDFIIKFNFSSLTDTNYLNLKYGNYLAVQFSKYSADVFNLSSQTNNYSCVLYDENGKSYKLLAIKPSLSPLQKAEDQVENNIAYCEFTDQINVIPNNIFLTLIISLDFGIQAASIHNVSLLVTTANHKDKTILDSCPSIGTVNLFEDYEEASLQEPKIKINDALVLSTQRECVSSCLIYPYDSLKIDLILEATTNIDLINLHNIIIQIDGRYIEINNELLTLTLIPIDTTNKELAKNQKDITLTIFNNYYMSSSDSFDTINRNQSNSKFINSLNVISNNNIYSKNKIQLILNNIGENMFRGRIFRLNITGIKATDNNIGEDSNIEVLVIAKNTYRVASYQKSLQSFKITPISIGNFVDSNFSGISHPDYIDIYQSSAWPIRFIFSLNQQSIKKPSWVVIQHSNASKSNRFNFIASTCDFSETISNVNTISNEFGKRPICYPLINSLVYEGESASTYMGSGVFFKLNEILNTLKYTVTIWGYADICGENQMQLDGSLVKYPNPLGSERAKSIAKFRFSYSIYKSINSDLNTAENFKNHKTIYSNLNKVILIEEVELLQIQLAIKLIIIFHSQIIHKMTVDSKVCHQ